MAILDNLRRFLGRVFSWFGYLTVIAELFFLVMLYFQAFFDVPMVKTILFPKSQETTNVTHSTTVAGAPSEPSWIIPLFAAVAVLLIGFGVFHLVTKDAPEAKEKVEAVVEKVALRAIKKIEKDKKISKKQERALTVRAIFWLKVCLAVVPLIVVLVFQNTTMSISKVTATFIMSGLSLSGVVWFTLERALYRLHYTKYTV